MQSKPNRKRYRLIVIHTLHYATLHYTTSSPSFLAYCNLRLKSTTPMTFAVTTSSSGAGILYGNSTTATLSHPTLPSRTRTLRIVSAAKKFSSRSKRIIPTTTTTTTTTDPELQLPPDIKPFNPDEYNLKPFTGKLPGTEPDIWEGSHMNIVGFIGDYIWILGGAFAVLGGLYAALNYNVGASDFKETPAYKESVQSQEFLEQPESSDSDVFDSNPTEVAPSLE